MSETIYLGTDAIRASNGKFNTDNRYIRGSVAYTFLFAKGKTMDMGLRPATPSIPSFRYAVGGYIVDNTAGTSSFNAVTQGVTL
jgi:hypothetical protein